MSIKVDGIVILESRNDDILSLVVECPSYEALKNFPLTLKWIDNVYYYLGHNVGIGIAYYSLTHPSNLRG